MSSISFSNDQTLNSSPETSKSILLRKLLIALFRTTVSLEHICDKLIADQGVTLACWRIIWTIASAKSPSSIPTLTQDLSFSRQAIQKQVNILIKSKLLVSLNNPSNKRSPYYALTDTGMELFTHIETTILLPHLKKMSQSHNEDDLKMTLNQLDKLATVALSAIDDATD